MSGRKDQTINPSLYGKPKRTLAEQDVSSVAQDRSLVIRLDLDWEARWRR